MRDLHVVSISDTNRTCHKLFNLTIFPGSKLLFFRSLTQLLVADRSIPQEAAVKDAHHHPEPANSHRLFCLVLPFLHCAPLWFRQMCRIGFAKIFTYVKILANPVTAPFRKQAIYQRFYKSTCFSQTLFLPKSSHM